ncbi:MAG: coenzyme F420-0:L-glutamate ligase [Candidatus Hydrothermarchaeales archaeon]
MTHIKAYSLKLPMIKKGDPIPELILASLEKEGLDLDENDIIVVTEKIVSKSDGRLIDLNTVTPSEKAKKLAEKTDKDPRLVELILKESNEILKVGENFIITETKQGLICANAGIDSSNIEEGKAKILPENPDKTASEIRKTIREKTGKDIGIIISDSFGRPFRYGSMGVAIGASGVNMLWDRRGEKDLYGRVLETTRISVGDSLASLANLVSGDADEKTPVVLIKGGEFRGNGKASDLLREKDKDIFRPRGEKL